MTDTRHKNGNWNVGIADSQGRLTFDQIKTAVLMDIRDELQTLNRLLHCANFTGMPRTLAKIRTNTANLPKVKRPR